MQALGEPLNISSIRTVHLHLLKLYHLPPEIPELFCLYCTVCGILNRVNLREMQNVFVKYNKNEQKKKLLPANTLCYLHINELFGRKLMKIALFHCDFYSQS
jgi:hypothetical protein